MLDDEPNKFSEAALEKGRLLFAKGWEFLLGVPSMKFMPPEGPLEISFAGRSNVGKSSLINALVNQKGLARTSNTPGRTQELNYFIPKDSGEVPDYAIVDMPGYGYAKAPKNQVEAWTRLVFSYLRGRTTLRRVFVLIDSRHGIKKNDEEVFKMMDKAACSYQIVLTKSDKIKVHALENLQTETLAKLSKHPAAYPEVLTTSSEKGEGIAELRAVIASVF